MALNTYEMCSNGIKLAFFPKNYEKLLSSWGLFPQTPITSGGSGLRPQIPVCNTFDLKHTSLLKHVSQIRYFCILSIGLIIPLLERIPSYVPTPDHGF